MISLIDHSVEKIHARLSKISTISLEEFSIVGPIIKFVELGAGDFFIQPGESSQRMAITLSGLLKTYYLLENGKEHISHFAQEGSFLGVYTDMLKKVPSSGSIEAIEPSTLLVMNYEEMLEVTKKSLAWAHLLRRVAEQRYIYRSDKDRNINMKSAQEKFEYFCETHPNLINRLPQNQIALYLNITPATLSRLKNSSGNYKK
ncbi:MAG: Crp/Fnr family transcriptional regulator [Bacteriovoracaceae bacterium]|nr:Crp/Fnr family transcriptional regulator [Bacteriovoracaceae bacterium]